MEVDRKACLVEQSPACTLDYASEGSESSVGDCSELTLEVCTLLHPCLPAKAYTQLPWSL